MSNEVCTEGLQAMLESYFTGEQSSPVNFYMGLCTDASIAEGAGLTDLTEVTGSGYARQTVPSDTNGFTSASTGTGDWKVTTSTETFSATGTWTGATHAFLATTNDNSGKLIAVAELSTTRTLQNGDSLQVSMELTLAG